MDVARMSGRNIFRKEALRSVSSPERLDERIVMLSPKLWLGLLSVLLVMVIAGIWGLFGRIDTQVQGAGILMKAGGIRAVTAKTSGIVQYLNVGVNDPVKQGQVLGVVEQPVLEMEIKQLAEKFLVLQKHFDEILEKEKENSVIRQDYFRKIRNISDTTIKKLSSIQTHLREIAGIYKGLREKGITSKVSYYQMLQNTINAEVNVTQQKGNKFKLPLEHFDFKYQQEKTIFEMLKEIKLIKNEFEIKRITYITKALLISPVTGTVIGVGKKPGDGVSPGETIFNIMNNTFDELTLDGYIPIESAKKVKRNQLVYVSPTNLEPQRYGYILGLVKEVGLYPETSQTLETSLKNNNLIEFLKSGNSAVIKVEVELLPDPESDDDLRWSSRPPAGVSIVAGTPCNLSVVVERRPPITYVVPWLKEKLLGTGRNLILEKEPGKSK